MTGQFLIWGNRLKDGWLADVLNSEMAIWDASAGGIGAQAGRENVLMAGVNWFINSRV